MVTHTRVRGNRAGAHVLRGQQYRTCDGMNEISDSRSKVPG